MSNRMKLMERFMTNGWIAQKEFPNQYDRGDIYKMIRDKMMIRDFQKHPTRNGNLIYLHLTKKGEDWFLNKLAKDEFRAKELLKVAGCNVK